MDDPWPEVLHGLRSRPNGYNSRLLHLAHAIPSSRGRNPRGGGYTIPPMSFTTTYHHQHHQHSTMHTVLLIEGAGSQSWGAYPTACNTALVPKLWRDAPHPAVGADM
jgi:hypothetical protein